MFDNINDAITYIESKKINSTSLEDFKLIFKKYQNFQNEVKYVHVTGTNGKGSTSKMISDIVSLNNYKVGLFTSPHILVSNDRIRINDINISDEDLLGYINYFYNDIEEFKINFFQIYTLIALKYFYDRNCDLAVIEVGIGGLYDSTNVIDAIVSIITNINIDHTDKLGSSLREIAYQKAGIIKLNKDVVVTVKNQEALSVIKKQSEKLNANLKIINSVESNLLNNKLNFNYKSNDYSLNSLATYQVDNALLSIEAVNILKSKYGFNIDLAKVKLALDNFEWIGRFELVSINPEIILDGAHNIAGIKALINSDDQNSVVIFSALKDKDYHEMIKLLKNRYDELVFCEFDFYRSLKITDLSEYDFMKFTNINDSLNYLKNKYPNRRIIICGSLYFISEISKMLRGK